MGANYGWSLVEKERKREIIAAIARGDATAGPTHAEIDLTDRCNVACYFCNQQDVRTTRQLPLDKVFSLLDELVQGGLRSVRLSGGGDPLAHRDVAKVLARLTALGVNVDNVNTNGALLDPGIGERLIENGCRELIVSLNAVDAADYHRMMQVRPGTFDKVLANVRGIVAQRGERPLPVVTVQFLIDRENYRRIPDMYALGRGLGADRITISPVLDIPLERIDHNVLLAPQDSVLVMPYFAAALAADRDANLLSLFGPFPAWNEGLDQIRASLATAGPAPPIAASYKEKNGACFFGWYSATIRGNGDLYPCCLLMSPGYKPLGNALATGTFGEQWRGAGFTRLRREMREVLLRGGRMFWREKRFKTLAKQCVEPNACFLKNMYFRHDEEFYRDLDQALDQARKKEVRWLGSPRQMLRAAEVFAYRCYHGARVRYHLGRRYLASRSSHPKAGAKPQADA
ncbi:MAG TPA: radical SAM/SPASM domain-containing protein [Thermoanaerobaculia bacterium]|nr:radical SAM/SPASM domain-containing protein [Thermoanaerobaculia bacterium]